MAQPSLFVFDLDYTLWPFRVGKNVHSPFSIINNKVIDNRGKELICYPEVHGILSRLYTNGCKLAIASRIEDIPGAYQLLQLFDINSFFHYKEIYPMTKSVHFLQLHMKSGVQFKDMLFFDDNKCNVRDANKLCVTSVQVLSGLTNRVLEEALLRFESNHLS